MSQTPSLPPTPRRRALARAAGQVPLSRALVAAAAWTGATAALAWTGSAAAGAIAAMATTELRAATTVEDPVGRALAAGGAEAVLTLAAPFALAAAGLALLAHVTQVRALWLPRRRVRGAPEPRGRASRRAVDGVVGLVAAAVVLVVVARVGWLFAGDLVRAGTSVRGLGIVAAASAQIAAALVGCAALDWLLRVVRHAADLRMTAGERHEDERASSLDPRWQRYRRERAREGAAASVAGCALLIIDDRSAAAIRWHARWSPVPRVAVGGVDRAAHSLVAMARRHGVPVQRDAALAEALARLPAGAPVPTRLHEQLARQLAAVAR